VKAGIRTRSAEADDAAALARLNAAFNDTSDPPEQIAARLRDPRRVETPIFAEIDGQIVGFAAVRIVPSILYAEPQAELTELYVEAEYRRRGVGRALIDHAVRLAREAGADALLVLTGLDNEEAQRLYHATGFEDYGLALYRRFRE
jgi:ribosomal protein S18 acetylase RimI-like enzyme